MLYSTRAFYVLILSVTVTMPVSAENNVQNTEAAVRYFQNELDFKTNPHGTRESLDGKRGIVTIIDVRAAKDYAAGHIPGAINIPYEQYEGFQGNEKDFPGLRKDGYNYIYCYSHLCNLAQKAAHKFASLGYPVKEMVGGFAEWVKEGHPVEK